MSRVGLRATLPAALLALASCICAQDWPQWRGPDRNGACTGGPELIDSIPDGGLKVLWQSEPILDLSHPGERGSDVGYSTPVAAGGKVFLYLNQRVKDDSPLRLSWGIRNRLGCFEPPLPDDLAARVEAARTSPERNALPGEEVPVWANDWLHRNLTHAQYTAFSGMIANRLMRGEDAIALDVLKRVADMRDKAFAKAKDLDDALKEAGLEPGRISSILKELNARRVRAFDVVLCIDAATGKTIWKMKHPGELFEYGTSSTPCVVGDRIYVSGGKTIYCLNIGDGSEVWQVPSPVKEVSASPLVVDGILLIQAGSLCALDAKDGKFLWARPEFKGIHASPAIWEKDGKKYAVQNTGIVELQSGKLLWQIGGGFDSSPVVSGDLLVTCNMGGFMCHRLALDKPQELWKVGGHGMTPSTPIVVDGLLFGTKSQSGPLFCVDMATGNFKWKGPDPREENYGTASFNSASLIMVDGKIFVDGGNPLSLAIVKAKSEQFELLGRGKLAASSMRASTPIIADGRLFIRGKEALVCYDLAKRR